VSKPAPATVSATVATTGNRAQGRKGEREPREIAAAVTTRAVK